MSSKLTRAAYEQLIQEDIEAIQRIGDTLERNHIEHVLLWSIDHFFPPQASIALSDDGVAQGDI